MARLQATCPEALTVAREILAQRQSTAAMMLVASDKALEDALKTGELDLSQVLSRASSVFQTNGGDNRLRFGREVLAQDAKDYYQVGEYDNEYMWSEGRNVKVLPQGKECVELVLKHLGLGRDTTIRELDHLEPLFVCMTCPVAEKRTWLKDDYPGRVVFGWRKLVGHHYR